MKHRQTPSFFRRFPWRVVCPAVTALLLALAWPAIPAHAADKIVFNRDIRPILTDNCLQCHGPDKGKRKADMRLDIREDALKVEAFVPGKPDDSDLVARIFS